MKRPSATDKILAGLELAYPEATTALEFNSPFQLLVATILSAQSTDKQVNTTTRKLFQKYSTPEDFAALDPKDLEQLIKGCGLFRNKSKNIVAASKIIVERENGKVPQEMDSLVSLPGVGRKTANVVLSNAFGKDAIAVDTHVFRVANRLGLAESSNVFETEQQLRAVIPKESWSKAHHWLIFHGRKVCSARNPKCNICPIREWCKFEKNRTESSKPVQ